MSRTAVPEDRFSVFSVSTHSYKVVGDHPILVSVLIPKRLLHLGPQSEEWKRKWPLMVKIHGGWLMGGERDFAPWWPRWTLSLAYQHDAIIVSPDYRLLPEASAEDILDDLDDFWAWLSKDLPSIVRKESLNDSDKPDGLEVDLNRVAVVGESAGGYCAIQLALAHFKPPESGITEQSPRIRAVIATYPMLNFRSRHWSEDYDKQIAIFPQFPTSIIDDHLASIARTTPKPVISSAAMDSVDSSRGVLAVACVQHGRFLDLLGEDRDSSPGKRRVHPEERIADGAKLPSTLFVHGADDSAVPVEGTDKFVELLRRHKAIANIEGEGSADVLMYARVQGEHGFDSEMGPEDATWIKDGLNFVEKLWIG